MPLKVIDVLQTLDLEAKNFLNKTDSGIKRSEQEAILVDFINYVGSVFCVDYCMYTKDLDKKADCINKISHLTNDEKKEILDSIKTRIERYSIFSCSSIIRNKHMNTTNGVLDVSETEIELFLLDW